MDPSGYSLTHGHSSSNLWKAFCDLLGATVSIFWISPPVEWTVRGWTNNLNSLRCLVSQLHKYLNESNLLIILCFCLIGFLHLFRVYNYQPPMFTALESWETLCNYLDSEASATSSEDLISVLENGGLHHTNLSGKAADLALYSRHSFRSQCQISISRVKHNLESPLVPATPTPPLAKFWMANQFTL